MAVWLFTEAIFQGRTLKLFNSGHMRRGFTYVDDVIEAVVRLIKMAPENPPAQPPHNVYNVGNSQPVEVIKLVDVLENVIGKLAQREFLPMRPVDVLEILLTVQNSSV